MDTKRLNWFFWILFSGLVIIMFFELFNDLIKSGLFFIGIFAVLFPKKLSAERTNAVRIIGILFLIISLLSTVSAWLLIVLVAVVIFSVNQDALNIIKQSFIRSKTSGKNSEFITVKLGVQGESTARKSRTSWFGSERKDTDIYEWDDVNYTKVAGNTVIDLGNTIVPKKQNTVMIRQGIGNIKVIIPAEVAVSLDLNVFLGKIIIGEKELEVNNETVKWKSSRYESSSRQIKIVSSVLFGEIEVVFI